MKNSHANAITVNAVDSKFPVKSQNDWETRSIRIILLVLVLLGVISVLVPGISNRLWIEIGFVPQVLIGFAILALLYYFHLASQRKLLRTVSAALIAATSYVDRLEQVSLIDPHTQLFNRKYLDPLLSG